jgi:hypothetical protein
MWRRSFRQTRSFRRKCVLLYPHPQNFRTALPASGKRIPSQVQTKLVPCHRTQFLLAKGRYATLGDVGVPCFSGGKPKHEGIRFIDLFRIERSRIGREALWGSSVFGRLVSCSCGRHEACQLACVRNDATRSRHVSARALFREGFVRICLRCSAGMAKSVGFPEPLHLPESEKSRPANFNGEDRLEGNLKRADVPHFSIYTLRHVFCTRLSTVAPDAVVQRAMRHTSPETKRIYNWV